MTSESVRPAIPSTGTAGADGLPRTVGVAEREIEQLMAHGFLAYRFALVATSAFRMVAKPEEVVRPLGAWSALAIDAGSATVEALIARSHRTSRVPAIAAIEGATGAVMGALALRSIRETSWQRGSAWSCGSNDWRAAGGSITSVSTGARVAGVLAQSLPYLAPGRHTSLRQLRRHMVPELATFGIEGALLANSIRSRARQIDDRVALLADEQTRLALTIEELALRHDIIESTIVTLRRVRDLMATDRGEASAVATREEERLRSWLASNAAVLSSSITVDSTDEEAGAEERMRQVARLVETAMRVMATVLALERFVGAGRRSTPRTRLAQGVIAVRGVLSFSLLTTTWTPQVRQRILALSDLAAVAAAELAEAELRGNGQATGWLQAFCVSCAASAGTLDGESTISRRTAVGVAGIRSTARLLGPGSRLRRSAGAIDELISLGSSTMVGRWLLSTSIAQVRDLTSTSLALALERNRFQLEARRLRHQAFVHDGAVQVLLWIRKDDLDDDQLRRWIDQELPRLEAVAHGAVDAVPSSLAQSVSDLVDGFRHIGLTIDLRLGAMPAIPPSLGLSVVDILNEALTNVFKHTSSRTALLELGMRGTDLVARVVDEDTGSADVSPGSGIGTTTMIGQADHIGARLEWRTTPSGGTQVSFELPLEIERVA